MERTLVILDPTLKRGFTSLPNAVLTAPQLSLAAKGLYGLLLMFAWQENECFPGQERLAAVGNCSERSVRTYLTELRQAGYISWKQRGLNETNIYYINNLSTLQTPEALSHKDRQNLPVKTGKQPEAVEAVPHPENTNPETLGPQGPAKSAGQDRKPGPAIFAGQDRQNLPTTNTQLYTCLSSLRSDKQGGGGLDDPGQTNAGQSPETADDIQDPASAPPAASSAGPPEPVPGSTGSPPPPEPKPPTNAALIGELGDRYRAVVPGARQQQGDFAFIGRLYNEYGYHEVLLGINDLAYKLEAGQVPDNPLVYLRGIIARRRKDDDRPQQHPPNPRGNASDGPEERKPSKYPTRHIIDGKEFYY